MNQPTEQQKAVLAAIRGAVRADASHNIVRTHTIREAKTLGMSDLIPDNWREDGSLKDTNGVWATGEQRDTANDVFTALEGAISDLYLDDCYVWVKDWYGSGSDDEPWIVVYWVGENLFQATFSYDDDQKVGIGEPVKVRPVTFYVERTAKKPTARRRKPRDLEWRKANAPSKGSVERRWLPIADIELRDDSDTEDVLKFTGFASVTGVPYPIGDAFTETIERGAFKRTLNNDDLDVQLLVNHRGLPLARTTSETLTLRETERGLFVEADLDATDPDVRALEPKMRRRDVTEMSFAFRSIDEAWNEDYTHRSLRSVDIHRGDVSIVSYGASPTTTATLRSDEARAILDGVEQRMGQKLDPRTARALLAEFTGSEIGEREDEEPEEQRKASPVVIPNYTQRARLRLATIRNAR